MDKISKEKEKNIERHNKQAEVNTQTLYNSLDTKLEDSLLSRDDRDSLMPIEINKYREDLKNCNNTGYSGHNFTGQEITRMTNSVEDYKSNVNDLRNLLKTYMELDISIHSKLLHLEDVDAILKIKNRELSSNKVNKATRETNWIINNTSELKEIEKNMQGMDKTSKSPAINTKIKQK